MSHIATQPHIMTLNEIEETYMSRCAYVLENGNLLAILYKLSIPQYQPPPPSSPLAMLM